MSFGKKIVVAVNFVDVKFEELRILRELDILKSGEVHFVHVFQTFTTAFFSGLGGANYPVDTDRRVIELSVNAELARLAKEVLPSGSEARVVPHCLFAENPKAYFCSYADELKADTIVVLGRREHGLFESSFAQYVQRHSGCHLIVMKG